jgi:hypothetical protein
VISGHGTAVAKKKLQHLTSYATRHVSFLLSKLAEVEKMYFCSGLGAAASLLRKTSPRMAMLLLQTEK